MFKNELARLVALTLGSVLVLAVSGCAFSGPGTHAGGDGFTDAGAPGNAAGKPEPPPDPVPH